jgi:integrase
MAETRGRKPKEQNRGHGEGSIYQRKDETWAGVSRYTDPETGQTKKHFVYGKIRKEVVTKKDAWEDEFKKGILPTKVKMTVEQWLETWMETYKKNSIRQNTFESYQVIINAHINPTIGKISLKELQPQQVQHMINEKSTSGRTRTDNYGKKGGPLSPRMVEYIYSVLHTALEQAVKNGLVVRNVCDAVDKPKKVKHEFMPWTTEETNQFLSSIKDSRLFPFYLTECGTGLRRSEILGLQWPDIDFKTGTLTVRRSLVRVKGGYKFGEPKTKKSRRTIPLPEQVIQKLKAWKAWQSKEKMAWHALHIDVEPSKKPEFNPLNMVFCDEIGQPLKPDFITTSFKRDLERAKLPDIRFHDLRHGHATMLLELGEDLKVISERLGHSSITMTADTYSHVREKMQKEASNKLDKVLNLNV